MTEETTTGQELEPSPQAGKISADSQEAQRAEREEVQVGPALKAELDEARRQAAKYRTELREVQERLSRYEQEKLTEQEKLAKRAEQAEKAAQELQARLRETAIRAEVMAVAQRLNVRDPDAAYKLLDISALSVDDSTGQVSGVEDAVKALLKAKPYLAGGAAGATNPQRSGDDVGEHNPIIDRIKAPGASPFDPAWLKRGRG